MSLILIENQQIFCLGSSERTNISQLPCTRAGATICETRILRSSRYKQCSPRLFQQRVPPPPAKYGVRARASPSTKRRRHCVRGNFSPSLEEAAAGCCGAAAAESRSRMTRRKSICPGTHGKAGACAICQDADRV